MTDDEAGYFDCSRRFTPADVESARARHPEIDLVRRAWAFVGRSGAFCACPATLLAVDAGVPTWLLTMGNIRRALRVDCDYLMGFATGVDSEADEPAPRVKAVRYRLGHEDGRLVAAALWPDGRNEEARPCPTT